MRALSAVLLAAAGAAIVCAPASAATGATLNVKPGADARQTVADSEACTAEARERVRTGPVMNPTGGAAGALAAGFLQGIEQGRLQTQYYEGCMDERGYAPVVLTEAETRQFRAARGSEARLAWLQAWLASPEAQARVRDANSIVVADLPEVPAEPFAMGGVRLDPASLLATAGPVRGGRAVLTAAGRYRIAARVAREVRLGGGVNRRIGAGALAHGVNYAPPGSPKGAQPAWCAPVTQWAIGGPIDLFVTCFTQARRGYRTLGATDPGQPTWLANETAAEGFGPMLPAGLELEPVDAASTPPMQVELKWSRSGRDGVEVRAVATRDRQSVTFWRGVLRFDAQGQAVLPFWTHRLVLTRSGRDVTAALTADGDGTGWSQLPPL